MQILRFFLTVSVLGEHDTQQLQQEIIDHVKTLMPNANGNELRIHLCPQEVYDKDVIARHEAAKKATKPAAAARPGSKAPAAAAGKQATKAKHLTTGQANHDGSGGNQE